MFIQTEKVNVEFSYGKNVTKALKNVTTNFEKGRSYALFGPSGSGKSTLLNVLSGLIKPTSGKILFNNQELSTDSTQLANFRKENIGIVFQNLLLVNYLNVIENVLIGADKINHDLIAKTHGLLSYLGIYDQRKNHISTLSGGQRQRVAIARSLINDPDLVLMDEPTANLDLANATKIMLLAKEIAHNKDKCVIVITHDTRMLNYVDQVVKITDGKVISQVK
jgi:putative ABC transport system ATP-binding protein